MMADSMGALWEKTSSKTGDKFMSGNIEVNGQKIDIVVFKNDKGDNEKKPDWKILRSQPRQ
jgi:uncharacterized protein (DUF736 family)